MAVSKIAYDGHTLIDLTGDTAVEADVASGKTFHKADGTQAVGIASGGGGTVNLQNKTVNLGSSAPSSVSADAGYDGLGQVSFNVSGISAGDIKSGASICGVNGTLNPTAALGKTITITVQVPVSAGDTFHCYYRGYDPQNPSSVIWRDYSFTINDPVNPSHTFTITLCSDTQSGVLPMSEIEDGFYIAPPDTFTPAYPVPPTGFTERFRLGDGMYDSSWYFTVWRGTTSILMDFQ